MSVDSAVSSGALLAMTQAIAAFTTFLPPITEVRQKNINDVSFAADVRIGEAIAGTLTIGVGLIVSSLTGSSLPTLVAMITATGLIAVYELTLRADRPMERAE